MQGCQQADKYVKMEVEKAVAQCFVQQRDWKDLVGESRFTECISDKAFAENITS